MTNQNKKIIVYVIAVYAYFALWLYFLFPILINYFKG